MTAAGTSPLTAALPEPERVRAARARLDEQGVEYVLSCWIDLLGIPKTKPVPLAQFESLCAGDGPQFAVHSVSMVPELGPADPDQVAIPDLDSLTVCPWDTHFAWVFADLYFCEQPYDVCPRSALKRVVATAQTLGYRVMAGIEPEFIAMRYDADGRPVKAFDDDPGAVQMRPRRQAFGYDAEFSLDSMRFLDEVARALDTLGWGLSNLVAEGAYSQFELDFGYADVVTTADRYTFLRVLLKEIAKRHGTFITFMAKPTQGDWRSGAHINHSIQAVDRPGENLFRTRRRRVELGRVEFRRGDPAARPCPDRDHVLDGQLVQGADRSRTRHSKGERSRGRRRTARYGANNRSTMLRLPQARWAIENRAADMCMNAYLSLAMTAAATLEGIEQGIEPAPPLNSNVYDLTEQQLELAGAKRLPTTLLEAVRAFDEDALARETLGPTTHDSYSRYKHDEWERFHEHITEWETSETCASIDA